MDINVLAQAVNNHFGLSGHFETVYSELDEVYSLVSKNIKYVVKLSYPGRIVDILDLESAILAHLQDKKFTYGYQVPVLTQDDRHYVKLDGYHLRLFEWIDARLLAECNPQTSQTRVTIGTMMGSLSRALKDFDHPAAHRFIKWDPSQLRWIRDHIDVIPMNWRPIFISKLTWFENEILPILKLCPQQINYNDGNDYNILCNWHQDHQCYEAFALIDWLDTVYTHRINELAITCAYSIMGLADPLQGAIEITTAYHQANPLNGDEIEVLYAMIMARLMISVTVSAINQQAQPQNEYLQVSDQSAWTLLTKWLAIHPRWAWYSLRVCCNLEALPDQKNILTELKRQPFTDILEENFVQNAHTFDFGIASEELGNFENYLDDSKINHLLDSILKSNNKKFGIGLYGEMRPFYSGETFKSVGNDGPKWRTQHLGIDIFAPEGTVIRAVTSGKIHSLKDNNLIRDYGPTIVTQHEANGVKYYLLYGHLSRTSLTWNSGDLFQAGETLGWIGDIKENGGWPPHVHFQCILDLMDQEGDFQGVGYVQNEKVWMDICPDPGFLLGLHPHHQAKANPQSILDIRKKILGYNLSVSYKAQPLWIQRGQSQYLIDHTGRKYLDTVNNVAHCGHEHPRVVLKGQNSMAVLNTNTRYLHENIIRLAEKLTSQFDPTLCVCYFTNSGTEANELAIRLAKNYTESSEIITMQWGYHGNSNTMVDLSSYKFDRKGGQGKPKHTHVIPMPDPLRGKYSHRPNATELYLKEVQDIIGKLKSGDQIPCALLAESILSCGGQIEYPDEFLSKAIKLIRASGGVYIADEVQTGLGRIGTHFSAYQLYDVVPDIVTLGKPLGNGHPIGAVLCTKEIADAFNNGMEYFNTFGGNPVSCAIAFEVLTVLEDESMVQNAKLTGQLIKDGLQNLAAQYPILADIRGEGLFLGFELMNENNPATKAANYLASRMRTFGILMSTDGPDDNVLKIKPPMTFDRSNAGELLDRLDKILKEDPMQV